MTCTWFAVRILIRVYMYFTYFSCWKWAYIVPIQICTPWYLLRLLHHIRNKISNRNKLSPVPNRLPFVPNSNGSWFLRFLICVTVGFGFPWIWECWPRIAWFLSFAVLHADFCSLHVGKGILTALHWILSKDLGSLDIHNSFRCVLDASVQTAFSSQTATGFPHAATLCLLQVHHCHLVGSSTWLV